MVKTQIGTANVTQGEGSTTYTIPSDAHVGENTIYGLYQENTTYEQAEGHSTLEIRIPTVVTVQNVLASIGETATFTATVKHHTDQNVNEGKIQFKLGGQNIGQEVNVTNGTATVEYQIPSNTSTGTVITAEFKQTNTYAASTSNNAVLTIRESTNITINDVSANRGSTATIVAEVTDENGDDIDTGSATLYIDNVQQGNSINVSNGTASFTYNVSNNESLGSHTIRVEYAQNNDYDSGTGTGSLIVRTPTFLSAVNVSGNKNGTVPVVIQVVDHNGSAVTSGTVDITVGSNQAVSAQVNNNGEATINFNIPQNASGTIQFTGQYVENTNYQGSSTSTNGVITIRKGVTVTLENMNAVLGEQITLTAGIKDENNDPVTSGDIVFEIEPAQ